MSTDKEMLTDFKKESKLLLIELNDFLDSVEEDVNQLRKLEDYGNGVDRIMGGAKSLAMPYPAEHYIHTVADYAALCKAVSYKASQVQGNVGLINTCVALLLDATEMLAVVIDNIDKENPQQISQLLNKTFLDRLRWVSSQFAEDIRGTLSDKGTTPSQGKKMSQNEIDNLLKKLGVG